VIGHSQRLLPDNTQHSKQTDIHLPAKTRFLIFGIFITKKNVNKFVRLLLKRQYDTQFVPQVHRRILYDDSWGVDEALNETAFGKGLVARGRHYVMAGAINGVSPNMAAQERELANRKLLSPWLFFSPGGTSFENWRANYSMEVRV
jgi:hypothetical protein